MALRGTGGTTAEPGQFFVQAVGPETMIILRNRGGVMRALFNVCRYGSRVRRGCCGTIFGDHPVSGPRWTYVTDGRLVGAPQMHEVEGFEERDHSLHPASLASWHGFLFLTCPPICRHWKKRWPAAGPVRLVPAGALARVRESITRSGPTGSRSARTTTSAWTARPSIRSFPACRRTRAVRLFGRRPNLGGGTSDRSPSQSDIVTGDVWNGRWGISAATNCSVHIY